VEKDSMSFNYALETFLSLFTVRNLSLIYGVPLGFLVLLRICDGLLRLIAAVKFKRFRFKVFLREEVSNYLFYFCMWTLLFAMGIALLAVSSLSMATFYAGAGMTGLSVLTIFLILVASAIYSILDNWQKVELGLEETGFVGDRKFFWNAIKSPFQKFLMNQGQAGWSDMTLQPKGKMLRALKKKVSKEDNGE
jgi:hypothetical protein